MGGLWGGTEHNGGNNQPTKKRGRLHEKGNLESSNKRSITVEPRSQQGDQEAGSLGGQGKNFPKRGERPARQGGKEQRKTGKDNFNEEEN